MMQHPPGKNRKGWVYVLSNPSLPGLVKIGLTQVDPYQRAKQLSRQTNMPTSFEVEYALKVYDCFAVEAQLHEQLKTYRVNSKREFFRLKPQQAKKRVESVARKFSNNSRRFYAPICLSLVLAVFSILWTVRQQIYPTLDLFIGIVSSNILSHISFVSVVLVLVVGALIYSPPTQRKRQYKSRRFR